MAAVRNDMKLAEQLNLSLRMIFVSHGDVCFVTSAFGGTRAGGLDVSSHAMSRYIAGNFRSIKDTVYAVCTHINLFERNASHISVLPEISPGCRAA